MSFPFVAQAFVGWDVSASFLAVTKQIIDFRVVETIGGVPYGGGGYGFGPYGGAIDLSGLFDGVFEPMPTQKLLIKPEGQRTWKWWTLWTTKRLFLDDVIVDRGSAGFRVMGVKDWGNSDYFEYDLTEKAET